MKFKNKKKRERERENFTRVVECEL